MSFFQNFQIIFKKTQKKLSFYKKSVYIEICVAGYVTGLFVETCAGDSFF